MKKTIVTFFVLLIIVLQLTGCSKKPDPLVIDFENPILTGIGVFVRVWNVVDDGTGNHVFEQSDPTYSDWPGFNVGGVFTNGTIKFRYKLLSYQDYDGSGRVNVSFREQKDLGGYVFSFDPYMDRNTLSYVEENGWSDYLIGSESMVQLEKQVWYNVRLEIKNENIKVFLNDTQIASVTDKKFTSGSINLGLGPNTCAQFDDIEVIYK